MDSRSQYDLGGNLWFGLNAILHMEKKKYPIEETFAWLIALPFRYWRWIVFPFLAYTILGISYIFWWHSYYSPLHKITQHVNTSNIKLYIIASGSQGNFSLDSINIKTDTACFAIAGYHFFPSAKTSHRLHIELSRKRHASACLDRLPIKYEIFGKYNNNSKTAVLSDSTVIYFDK